MLSSSTEETAVNRSLPLQRIAMVVASVAALATLGFAMAAGPETAPAVDPVALTAPEPTAAATEIAAPVPLETTEIDTVYVEPAATPEIIREVRRATPAPGTTGGSTTAAALAGGSASAAGDDGEGHDEAGDEERDEHDGSRDGSDDDHGEDDDEGEGGDD